MTHLGNSFGLNANQIMIDKSVSSFIQMFNHLKASFRYCDRKPIIDVLKLFVCLCMDALCGVCQINILKDSL